MSRTRRKARHLGCSVRKRASGKLGFRFSLALPDGTTKQFSEGTDLLDTPENLELMQKRAAVIGAEIRAGTFVYERWFPDSATRKFARPGAKDGRPERCVDPTVASFFGEWILAHRPPVVRTSLHRQYKIHFNRHIIPVLGEAQLRQLSKPDLERLRAALRAKELHEKTIRNIIDGTFRAFYRDAAQEHDGIHYPYPFSVMRWRKYIPPEPDPFSEEERDRLLDYFHGKRWKIPGSTERRHHYPYFALLFTLFFTGCRPSELSAARIGSLDPRAGTLRIRASRSRGEENGPKTSSADRVVRLTPRNVEVLRPIVPLHARPDGYLFKNMRGEPVNSEWLYDPFVNAQQALGIRIRDAYTTKDTYISNALTHGVNLTWLSEQTGVAEATLRKHYGRFVHTAARDAAELARLDPRSFRGGRAAAARSRRTAETGVTLPVGLPAESRRPEPRAREADGCQTGG